MAKLLVIGCVSLDTIHIEIGNERLTHRTIGGAGLYTALAARSVGSHVALYAPKPHPMPEFLKPIDELLDWFGPQTDIDEMPRLEIVHHGQGQATLIGASWGAESRLLPEGLANSGFFPWAHIAALSNAQRQMDFLQYIRSQYPTKISVGTYARVVRSEPDLVRKLFESSDFFFMNENEANLLFSSLENVPPSTSRVTVVTHGERGATVLKSNKSISIATLAQKELDPTGSGDTVCGVSLGYLSRGADFVEGVSEAMTIAGDGVQSPGPSALLSRLDLPAVSFE